MLCVTDFVRNNISAEIIVTQTVQALHSTNNAFIKQANRLCIFKKTFIAVHFVFSKKKKMLLSPQYGCDIVCDKKFKEPDTF